MYGQSGLCPGIDGLRKYQIASEVFGVPSEKEFMKNLVLAMLALTCSVSFAEEKSPHQELYEALNVSEVDPRDPGVLGASYKQKSIGGLVCSVTVVVSPNALPKYDCALKKR